MKKILVPFDFSQTAINALDFASQLAQKTSIEIILLHVIDPPAGSGINTFGEIESTDQMDKLYMLQLIKKTEERLHDIAIDQKEKNCQVVPKVVLGNPFEGIVKELSNSEADLIVMGTKGSSGIREYLVGSNTEKVVRYAKCPVISIPQAIEVSSIKHLAFATNLEDDQDFIIEALKVYQELFDATIHLVWINTFQVNQDIELVEKEMHELATRNGLKNYKIHIYNATSAEDGIMNFAKHYVMDMIALATHGHKGLAHLFMGSIAEDIVNHAKKPVWTYSSQAKD